MPRRRLACGRLRAKILGMPITMSVDAMAYNVDLFEANGINPLPVDLDDTDWNMETFLDLATKLTNDDRTQFGHGGGITCSNGGGIGTGTFWGAGPVGLGSRPRNHRHAGIHRCPRLVARFRRQPPRDAER